MVAGNKLENQKLVTSALGVSRNIMSAIKSEARFIP
jgi:hypothetical protein